MEVGVRLIGAFQLFLSLLLWPYYFLISMRKRPTLPPLGSPLLEISAQELARKIRHKEVSSREVTEAYVRRIREVNPVLNAVVEDRFSAALEEAAEVDEFLSTTTDSPEEIEKRTPLLGVPFTVKESCGLKDMPQCVGSKLRVGLRAAETGAAVKLILRAGAIPLAVTTTPEYCMSWETSNIVTGRTNNPYDPLKSAGGSSGGEGALIGSGASLFGIGSDFAGSIRVPAMFNGVYGHKPTPGIIPIDGHFPYSMDKEFQDFLVVGPLTRYVDDLKLTLAILCDDKAEELGLNQEVDVSKLNVFYKEDAGFSLVAVPVDHEIKYGVRDAAAFLRRAHKCRVEKAEMKELLDSVEICVSVFLGLEGLPDLLDDIEKQGKAHGNVYSELLKSLVGRSDLSTAGTLLMILKKHNCFIPKSRYPEYKKQCAQLRIKFNNLLKDNGVFLYPTFPTSAVYHDHTLVRTAGIIYPILFNAIGLPSTNVPIGFDRHRMPIGIQVVAGEKQDRLCLAVAKALDARYGGWTPPQMAI